MMALDINTIFYEYNYLYSDPKNSKKSMRFGDIVFLQLQQLAQVCNENVLVGIHIKITPKLLRAYYE